MSVPLHRQFTWLDSLLFLAASSAAGIAAADESLLLNPQNLEANGAVIGDVFFQNNNIFDLDNPLEDKWLYRTLNRFHIVTKPHTIERQLLFEPGEDYSARLTDESERILRSNGYINEAEIVPVSYDDGKVDLLVTTSDVWTLTPDITLGRAGGENRYGFGILEENLFGGGQKIGVSFLSDVDRDTIGFDFRDNNFRGNRYQLAVGLADSSDGHEYDLLFSKPFYALDARRSNGLRFLNGERIDQLYDLGEVVAEYNNRYKRHEAFLGWSAGLKNDWARRYFVGVAYEENVFSQTPDNPYPLDVIPEDRQFLYPFFGMQFLHDHYETTVNFDQIFRTEDRHLGLSTAFRIGYSSANAGSSESAWHFSAGLSNSLLNTKRSSFVIKATLDGRLVDGVAENALLAAASRYHHRFGERQLFYLGVSGAVGHNLDLDRPIQLGGDTGLRGYPLRYQTGDSKALLTVEQRYFTDWYLFRVLHVGGALFFDVGRTWGDSPVNGVNLGWLRDIGIGLRLGKTRMGGGVIHIDLAFPLDGEDDIDNAQLLFKVKSSF